MVSASRIGLGPDRFRRGRRLAIVAATVILAAGGGLAVSRATPAHAAGGVSVTVSSGPQPVATGQAMAYTINVANTGGADASGLTLTDAIGTLVAVAPQTSPFFKVSSGSCAYDGSTTVVTCTTASLPADGVWTVVIIGGQTAAPNAAVADTATVTGTESGLAFTGSGTTSTTIAPSLPAGFSQTKLAGGLKKPILIAFVPGSSDIWIGEQGGTIVDYRGGAISATPVVTLPNTFSQGECGLLGLAFDPNYATNGNVYISYVIATTNSSGTAVQYSRLSRFTASGGIINPATEKVYYQGNQVQNLHHAGNDLEVGPDGKLWWNTGDNVPAISNGEALNNMYGKTLRFNLDGTVPADNPFVKVSSAVPYIYAYGLRNPFRATFLPTGQQMVENTGSSYWEDLDTIQPGGNYGWPYYEGNCGSCGYLNPAFEYGHYAVDGAASAIAAYSGSTFPAAYDNVVFFGDYNRHDIEAVTFDPTYTAALSDTVFDTNAGTIADLIEGPDGNLYFVSIFEGTFSEITAPGPFNASSSPSVTKVGPAVPGQTVTSTPVAGNAPAASITAPATYNAGQTISFSGTATDPVDGTLPAYDYSWKVDFVKNGYVQPSYYAQIPGPFYGPVSGRTGDSITIPSDVSQTPNSYYQDHADRHRLRRRADGGHEGPDTEHDLVVGDRQRARRRLLRGRCLAHRELHGPGRRRRAARADRARPRADGRRHQVPVRRVGRRQRADRLVHLGGRARDLHRRLRRGDRHHAVRLDRAPISARRSPPGTGRLRGLLAELLPRRVGRGRVRRQRPVALRLPDAARGRFYRRPGPVPDQLLAVGQGRPDDQAVDRDRGRLGGCPGGARRAAPARRTSTGSAVTPTAASRRCQPQLPVNGYGVRMQTSGSKSSTGPVLPATRRRTSGSS